MAQLIPPRRFESIIRDGLASVRLSEFMESIATEVNSLSYTTISTDASRITTGNELVLCTGTGAKTITLNLSPANKEIVTVIRQGTGTISVSGDINGATSFAVATQYDSIQFIYIASALQWFILAAYIQ